MLPLRLVAVALVRAQAARLLHLAAAPLLCVALVSPSPVALVGACACMAAAAVVEGEG